MVSIFLIFYFQFYVVLKVVLILQRLSLLLFIFVCFFLFLQYFCICITTFAVCNVIVTLYTCMQQILIILLSFFPLLSSFHIYILFPIIIIVISPCFQPVLIVFIMLIWYMYMTHLKSFISLLFSLLLQPPGHLHYSIYWVLKYFENKWSYK